MCMKIIFIILFELKLIGINIFMLNLRSKNVQPMDISVYHKKINEFIMELI